MKLEVQDAATVGEVVRTGVVVGARKFGAQLVIAAGGRGVQRGPAPAKRGAPVRKPSSGGVRCYGCGKLGHLRRDCREGGGVATGGRPPFRCWGYGRVGHGISLYPGRSLPVSSAAGVPVPAANSGLVGGGVKRGGGPLAGQGVRVRPLGGGNTLNYLRGGAHRVAAVPQGVRA